MKKKWEEEEAERGWRREVKGALSGRGEEIKRKRRRWRQRGGGAGERGREEGRRSTEGEADAGASDACVQIITLMRFVESGTKRGGRGEAGG